MIARRVESRLLIDARFRARLWVVVGAELALVAILSVCFWHSKAADAFDVRLGRAIYAPPGTTGRSIAVAIGALGQPVVVAAGALGVAWWTWRRGRDLTLAAFSPAAVLASAAVCHLLKLAVERPRPATAVLAHEVDFSFPSGHATGAAALALAVVLLASAMRPPRQRLLVAAALTYASIIAISRLVIGVHYPTDVIAGIALGTAGTLIAGSACVAVSTERRSVPSGSADGGG